MLHPFLAKGTVRLSVKLSANRSTNVPSGHTSNIIENMRKPGESIVGAEVEAVVSHINGLLGDDEELRGRGLVPINGAEALFENLHNGVLLWYVAIWQLLATCKSTCV